MGGLGAPIPKHEGLPKVHLEKITCTACHSGPIPRKDPYPTQTSFAHGLGLMTEEPIEERAIPAIFSPAFRRGETTGRIGVYRYAYPIWWGYRDSKGTVVPLPFESIGAAFQHPRDLKTDEGLLAAFDMLAKALRHTPQACAPLVYINAGRIFERGPDGKVKSTPHRIADPYFWPIAHDVRPVGESLGAKGCGDCHSKDSPFFFGNVIRDPLAATEPKAPSTQPTASRSPTTQPTARAVLEDRDGSAPVPFAGNAAMARVASIIAAACLTAPTTQPADATRTPSSGTGPIPMHELTGYGTYLSEIGRFVDASEDQCFVCHAYKKLAWMGDNADLNISYVDAEQFRHTVHKDVPCLGCHTSIRQVPHGPGPHGGNCATVCHTIKDAKTGEPYSHASIAEKFAASVHGARPDDDAAERESKPACTYCHMNEIHPPPEGRPPVIQIVHLCST